VKSANGISPEERFSHPRFYWQYEYDVAAKYMIPLLRQWGVGMTGRSVLDVGCGEGGGVCAMHDAGAMCVGFDIDAGRVRVACELQGDRGIVFEVGNLYEEQIPFAGKQFDLLSLHDVFEHLENKTEMLEKLKGYLKPGGGMLITFPPYYSAYGAHQQLLNTGFARLPFFHLLPFSFRLLARLKNEDPFFVEEVMKLGRLKMGMKQFEQIAKAGGLTIAHKQAYLISPNHIRFGLKPIPAGPVADVPVLGELLCTGVVYLLTE
jgi:ubiquinone/menaquinone biosynthesis C-methylase UbiE